MGPIEIRRNVEDVSLENSRLAPHRGANPQIGEALPDPFVPRLPITAPVDRNRVNSVGREKLLDVAEVGGGEAYRSTPRVSVDHDTGHGVGTAEHPPNLIEVACDHGI